MLNLTHLTALHDMHAVLWRMHKEVRNAGTFADEMDVEELLKLIDRILTRNKMRPAEKPQPVEA